MRASQRKPNHLPKEFHLAHDFCFQMHDILAQLLVSGEKCGAFTTNINFADPSEEEMFRASDLFEWLDASGRVQDRARVLKTIVLPAVLSDMLHCIYEALTSSRKAKLNVTYILLRKPIQESLFLLESIVLDELDFASKLATNPLQLRGQHAGGPEAHTKRIASVLEALGIAEQFDPEWLARLRYGKEDGFDGICNLAIHLFTEHKAIRTERLNVNFIFSDWDSKMSQWRFLYSRLPYLLLYMWRVIEHIGESVCPTYPEYIADMSRRVGAMCLRWGAVIPSRYSSSPITTLLDVTRDTLARTCDEAGVRRPTTRDLVRMSSTGALPGEASSNVLLRNKTYEAYMKAAEKHAQ